MALSKKQRTNKEKLHAEFRGFLASNGITKKDAADYLSEDYNTFCICLAKNRYSNKKIQGFIDKKEEMKTALD